MKSLKIFETHRAALPCGTFFSLLIGKSRHLRRVPSSRTTDMKNMHMRRITSSLVVALAALAGLAVAERDANAALIRDYELNGTLTDSLGSRAVSGVAALGPLSSRAARLALRDTDPAPCPPPSRSCARRSRCANRVDHDKVDDAAQQREREEDEQPVDGLLSTNARAHRRRRLNMAGNILPDRVVPFGVGHPSPHGPV